MPKVCEPPAPAGCVPGCSSKEGTGQPAWCAKDDAWSQGVAADIWNCAFRPEDLGGMLRHHRNERRFDYNEVIVDTKSWQTNLPELVMAVFFLDRPGMSNGQRAGGEFQARGVHQHFRQLYPQVQTPLVALDTTKALNAFTQIWPPLPPALPPPVLSAG